MNLVLALDAGGTTTRALVLDLQGRVLGAHRAAAGNPTSVGRVEAASHLGAAAAGALSAAGATAGSVGAVAVALAGRQGVLTAEALAEVFGLRPGVRVDIASDVLAMFHSAAGEDSGSVVIAGTGSVAARVRADRLHRVVGGSGWLLGDHGSGFAIGRRVVRAAVAHLDGGGPPTVLTDAVLSACGLEQGGAPGEDGRPEVLPRLIATLSAERPVAQARFAPLAFTGAADGDAVARRIVTVTHDELAHLVAAVRSGDEGGPLVLGGSVWDRAVLPQPETWSPALRAALGGTRFRPARDGAVGAAVLALRAGGVYLDAHHVDLVDSCAEALR